MTTTDTQLNSLLDKQAIIDGFNRASKSYDSCAILQQEVASRILERLQWMNIQPQVIIDIGGGTGDLSLQLAEKYPDAQIFVIDIAESMLQLAKSKYYQKGYIKTNLLTKIKNKLLDNKHRQIQYICADAENIPLFNHKVDLIISNLAIQWCENTQQLFNELQRILSPSGCLLFSTFGVDTLSELKQSWSVVSQSSHVNNFTDMHELGDAMLLSGLQDPVMDSEKIVMEYTQLTDLFKDLKQIGAQNHLQKRPKGLTSKSKFKAMQAAYEQFRLTNNKYPASYEVVYGHAWGKELNVGIKKTRRNSTKITNKSSTIQPINFVS